MDAWWQSFFDDDYLHVWGTDRSERTAREVDGLWTVLGLERDARVLDAPCGSGRLSQPLAGRGAIVVVVDQSAPLLAHAERNRDGIGTERLRYRRHDLRAPVDEGGFDAAINITMHRDAIAILRARGGRPAERLSDGTLVIEEPRFDVVLMARAGLAFVSAHRGCSPEPYQGEGPDAGGRVGLLARPV